MSLPASIAAWAAELPALEKLVLLCLADHADSDGRCWPSVAHLAKRCGLHRATVIRSIQSLTTAKHISVERELGRPNRYVVGPLRGEPVAHSN